MNERFKDTRYMRCPLHHMIMIEMPSLANVWNNSSNVVSPHHAIRQERDKRMNEFFTGRPLWLQRLRCVTWKPSVGLCGSCKVWAAVAVTLWMD